MIGIKFLLQVRIHIFTIDRAGAFHSEPMVDALAMEDMLASR